MNDKQLIKLLKEASNQTRLNYITTSVKAKILKNRINEVRKARLNEDVTPAAMRTDPGERAATPFGRPFKGFSGSTGYSDPDEVNMELYDYFDNDAPLAPSGAVGSLMGDEGKSGSYANLLSAYNDLRSQAGGSKKLAGNIDYLVANLLMPGRSDEDMKKLRSAAARLLRQARKPLYTPQD